MTHVAAIAAVFIAGMVLRDRVVGWVRRFAIDPFVGWIRRRFIDPLKEFIGRRPFGG